MSESDDICDNFLRRFRDKDTKRLKNFTAQQFMEVWEHYDSDGNGYIEGKELDKFLKEFVLSVTKSSVGVEAISTTALKELKKSTLDAYDENRDDRIEIGELAQILPTEENFLLLFRRDNPLDTRVEFMKIWRRFDSDCNGFIDAVELRQFLQHLLTEAKPNTIIPEEKMKEYTDTMLKLFDQNKDGHLQLSEMAKLLPVKENFLSRPIFKNASRISKYDIERVFHLYDRDKNGFIEGTELMGFMTDLIALVHTDYNHSDVAYACDVIMSVCDTNGDNKIDVKEMSMVIIQSGKMENLYEEPEDGEDETFFV